MQDEYKDALQMLRQARQNFELAAPDYIDLAIADLTGAEIRLSLALQDRKEGGEPAMIMTGKHWRRLRPGARMMWLRVMAYRTQIRWKKKKAALQSDPK